MRVERQVKIYLIISTYFDYGNVFGVTYLASNVIKQDGHDEDTALTLCPFSYVLLYRN